MKYRLRKLRIATALALFFGLYQGKKTVEQRFGPPPHINVGSWNLEWLGTPEKRGGTGSRTQQDLEGIARVIQEELNLAVVVLQEINVESQEWRTLANLLTTRGYTVSWGSNGYNQRMALAYDIRQVQARAPAFEGTLQTNTLGRAGCSTTIKPPLFQVFVAGSFDFAVAAVHLKSDVTPRCNDNTFSSAVRVFQMEHLVQNLQAFQQVKSLDNDVMVLGDFNESVSPGAPPGSAIQYLRSANFAFLTDTVNRAPDSGNVSYRKGDNRWAPDHIAVPGATMREYIPLSTRYLPRFSTLSTTELEAFRRRYSDHCPVWSQFRTDLPDDD